MQGGIKASRASEDCVIRTTHRGAGGNLAPLLSAHNHLSEQAHSPDGFRFAAVEILYCSALLQVICDPYGLTIVRASLGDRPPAFYFC